MYIPHYVCMEECHTSVRPSSILPCVLADVLARRATTRKMPPGLSEGGGRATATSRARAITHPPSSLLGCTHWMGGGSLRASTASHRIESSGRADGYSITFLRSASWRAEHGTWNMGCIVGGLSLGPMRRCELWTGRSCKRPSLPLATLPAGAAATTRDTYEENAPGE